MNAREEKIITPAIWASAGLAYLFATVCIVVFASRPDSDFNAWPLFGRVMFSVGLPLIFSTWVLLVCYVYHDARRRGMRYLMWTLLAILVPNALGFILYFILRGPLLETCLSCNAKINPSLPFCPSCGASMSKTCPQCRRAVEPAWSHCGNCGAPLAESFK